MFNNWKINPYAKKNSIYQQKGLTYQDTQKWLDTNYSDKQQTKEIIINVWENLYGSLIISDYPQLEKMFISCQKKLVYLQVNNCPKLRDLGIFGNKLTNLDLSNNLKLKELSVSQNNLTNLNINHLKDLEWLFVSKSNFTELNINNLVNLKKLYCEDNVLTNLIFPQNCKLEELTFSNNSFQKDLSFLSGLRDLRELDLNNSNFYGSLEPLKNMSKLEILNISDTDIDSGLEYLPDSLKWFSCSVDKKPKAKAKTIYDLFVDEQGVKTSYGDKYIENFPQKLKDYKQKNQLTQLNAENNYLLNQLNKTEETLTNNDLIKQMVQIQIQIADIEQQAQIIHNPPKST